MKRHLVIDSLLLLVGVTNIIGCHANQAANSPVPDLSTTLYKGMTDKEALRKLGITGPVTGVGSLGWCYRSLESPNYPGFLILLDERIESDGELHLYEWQTVRPAKQ